MLIVDCYLAQAHIKLLTDFLVRYNLVFLLSKFRMALPFTIYLNAAALVYCRNYRHFAIDSLLHFVEDGNCSSERR